MDKAPAIGIDLGTTCCCVGVVLHGKVEIIANEQGFFVTPSYVAFNDVERLIGDSAKDQIAMNAENTIFDAKRLIGRKYDDCSIQNDMKTWPFAVKNVDSDPKIEITYKGEKETFAPEQIAAMLLTNMKETAEKYLSMSVDSAVITVPAYFNNEQRQATYDAGVIAGLNVLQIINEPTAAAVAYGVNHRDRSKGKCNVLVFDLGGGTFDVSIMSVDGNNFDVKATNGDTHLGGEDFDCRMVEHCVKMFKNKHKIDISSNKRAVRRLRTACEKGKRILSSATQTTIEVDSLSNGIDFSALMTRPLFEQLNADLFRKTLDPVGSALADAKMTKEDINVVLLVGGSTRIPKVQKLLQEFFPNVALNHSINPDEAVAYGAAVHAAILNGNNSEKIFGILIRDVTPLSLGITVRFDDRMSVIIQRNTPIPESKTEVYQTAADNQTTLAIDIRQGEHEFAKHNNSIGKFEISNIPKAPAGVSKIYVTFDININGILRVTARDKQTGNTEAITIEKVCGHLRKDEIDRMVAEAQKYQEDDKVRRRARRAYNAIQQKCYELMEYFQKSPAKCELDPDAASLYEECHDTLEWIETHPNERPEQYEDRLSGSVKSLTKKFEQKFKIFFSE